MRITIFNIQFDNVKKNIYVNLNLKYDVNTLLYIMWL